MGRVFFLISMVWATALQANCRQALALALDVSGSVDAGEYRLQLDGLAAALDSAPVRDSLFAMPQAPVSLAIYEWSGQDFQNLLVPWATIATPADLAQVTQKLRNTRRVSAPPTTAIGAAILYGADLLDQKPSCWKRTLDISGDGKSNTGPEPHHVATPARLGNIVINGLIVGVDTPARLSHEELEVGELTAYYKNRVLAGVGAFSEVALGFEDYERAMQRKLLRELEFLNLSHLDHFDQ